MTKEEIIEMAKQSKMPYFFPNGEIVNIVKLEDFANMVAEHERNACAKEADRTFYSVQAAENIRARGQE